jgi:hypothetical protein
MSAPRSRRRKLRHGVRTASRQAECSDRLMRASLSLSMGASPDRFGRGVYARTRPLRQGLPLIHRHKLRPRDFADFEV